MTTLTGCVICGFALTALAHADERGRAKTMLALEHHLARDHRMTQEQIQQALKAAQGVTG